MSSRLSREIARLASETRRRDIKDHKIIVKLTAVVGYGHMVEHHPHCREMLRKHLEAFMDMVCHEGYRELCEHSERIMEIADGEEDAA